MRFFESTGALEHGKFMVCMAHRMRCKTPHFPKHKFPVHGPRTVQSTAEINCIVESNLAHIQYLLPTSLPVSVAGKNVTSERSGYCHRD